MPLLPFLFQNFCWSLFQILSLMAFFISKFLPAGLYYSFWPLDHFISNLAFTSNFWQGWKFEIMARRLNIWNKEWFWLILLWLNVCQNYNKCQQIMCLLILGNTLFNQIFSTIKTLTMLLICILCDLDVNEYTSMFFLIFLLQATASVSSCLLLKRT